MFARKAPWRPGWRWIQNAGVWRGRDDPMGELASRINEVVPILTGPIDNFTTRVVSRRQVDELIAEQFAELNEEAIWRRIGIYRCRHRRMRIHHYQEVVYPPVYAMAFQDPHKPLFVDIGSGDGKMIMLLAKRNPHMNYLGLEKRPMRVEICERFMEVLRLKNLHFIGCNATISFQTLLATYPGPIAYVSIIGPDPHLKGSYFRIRMIRKRLAEQIISCLSPGGKLLFQTEFVAVAAYLRKYFDPYLGDYLSVVDEGNTSVYDEDGCLLMNPIGVRSATEISAVAHGEKIWRRLYERSDKKYSKPEPASKALYCNIEAPNHQNPLPKRERIWNKWMKRLNKPIVRRDPRMLCRRIRRLPEGVSRDIILNWETYPRDWFTRLMEKRRLKKYRRRREPRPRIKPIHKRDRD